MNQNITILQITGSVLSTAKDNFSYGQHFHVMDNIKSMRSLFNN